MKPETTVKVKFGVLGLICGAVIAIIIGFGWGVGQGRHYAKDDRRGGLGESSCNLRCPIYEATEP